MIDHLRAGGRAITLFIAGLKNVNGFKPNHEASPELAELLKAGSRMGLVVKSIGIYHDPKSSAVRLWSPDLKISL